ncbi:MULTISPECIES: sensor domain-containing diguanylate cyclase [Actinopolyspora]|uniref:Diguanylate cyclase (GGDEF) domain-containing protein n=1 Tax=Actinopolyspora saharensis TaxID=995062 RepID=A0A1H1FSM8_9ACTN|nr:MULTISPECIES: GGDEF domain-containing protein [Actinopolyspora]NHD19480.1 GGDEF domain-containing protein [Actinopolyspora sp. BKK2]NHE77420.1 GGDEF domain-containing protein [Actinopolyspora sp. BKK1]SDR03937.1 diguanylate cyclase (GGDEF) domain-containing protein [Actinopolyspora saharensis]
MSVVYATSASQLTGVWDELIMGLTAGFMLTDERGQVLATNDAAADLLRLDRTELLTGSRPDGWAMRDSAGAHLPDWSDLTSQVLRTGTRMSTPVVVTEHDVPSGHVWMDYQPVRMHSQQRVLMFLQPVDTDVSHSRGMVDPLTGLPGRVLLLDRLDQALARARCRGTLATLVLADIRRLEQFNVEHGFAQGDELLTVLAGRLRQSLSDEHTVARYGGDEFALVVEHPSGTGSEIAERARGAVARPMRLENKQIRPSVRVSWVTSDGNASVHSVISRAEQQLES